MTQSQLTMKRVVPSHRVVNWCLGIGHFFFVIRHSDFVIRIASFDASPAATYISYSGACRHPSSVGRATLS